MLYWWKRDNEPWAKILNAMKYHIIVLILFCPALLLSQDCSRHIKSTYDKFNDRTILEGATPFVVKSNDMQLGITVLSLERGECSLVFGLGDGWVYGDEPIVFLMENGDRLSLKNKSKVNYNGNYFTTVQTNLNIPEIHRVFELLSTEKVKSLKVDFFEADLSQEDSQRFFEMMQCIKMLNTVK
mgnify:CR=1 FL=1